MRLRAAIIARPPSGRPVGSPFSLRVEVIFEGPDPWTRRRSPRKGRRGGALGGSRQQARRATGSRWLPGGTRTHRATSWILMPQNRPHSRIPSFHRKFRLLIFRLGETFLRGHAGNLPMSCGVLNLKKCMCEGLARQFTDPRTRIEMSRLPAASQGRLRSTLRQTGILRSNQMPASLAPHEGVSESIGTVINIFEVGASYGHLARDYRAFIKNPCGHLRPYH